MVRWVLEGMSTSEIAQLTLVLAKPRQSGRFSEKITDRNKSATFR